jgi:hypothetical protein
VSAAGLQVFMGRLVLTATDATAVVTTDVMIDVMTDVMTDVMIVDEMIGGTIGETMTDEMIAGAMIVAITIAVMIVVMTAVTTTVEMIAAAVVAVIVVLIIARRLLRLRQAGTVTHPSLLQPPPRLPHTTPHLNRIDHPFDRWKSDGGFCVCGAVSLGSRLFKTDGSCRHQPSILFSCFPITGSHPLCLKG